MSAPNAVAELREAWASLEQLSTALVEAPAHQRKLVAESRARVSLVLEILAPSPRRAPPRGIPR